MRRRRLSAGSTGIVPTIWVANRNRTELGWLTSSSVTGRTDTQAPPSASMFP